jgi:hypothetical protein
MNLTPHDQRFLDTFRQVVAEKGASHQGRPRYYDANGNPDCVLGCVISRLGAYACGPAELAVLPCGVSRNMGVIAGVMQIANDRGWKWGDIEKAVDYAVALSRMSHRHATDVYEEVEYKFHGEPHGRDAWKVVPPIASSMDKVQAQMKNLSASFEKITVTFPSLANITTTSASMTYSNANVVANPAPALKQKDHALVA